MTRVAVITGAGTGIGAATARSLAHSCTDLVLVGRRVEKLEETATSIAASHPLVRVRLVPTDVSDPVAVQHLVDVCAQNYDGIDVIVNNAGSTQPKMPTDLVGIKAVWDSTVQGNLISVVLVTEGLLPQLRSPGGRVVIVGSFASVSGNGSVAYATAKTALEGYARNLCRQHGAAGQTFNVVAPGYTGDTELVVGRISEDRHASLVSGIAIGRAGTSDEIAAAITFLSSPETAYVNGQVLFANGGMKYPG